MVYNIEQNEAIAYKNKHPEIDDNQVIMYYRPDLAENILGELVPNPFYKGE